VSEQYLRFNGRAPPEPQRCALLETLVARADESVAVDDWRADAFRILAPQSTDTPALAAVALLADCAEVRGAWVCMATPVHYLAEMSNVRLPNDGILSLQPAAAAELALDFNKVWRDSGMSLRAGHAGHLYCILDQALEVTTRDPETVYGRHLEEYLPTGVDAARLRQLMSEMEMWLFEHRVNAARAAAGLPAISGLWLWGAGAPLASLPKVQGSSVGDDLLFSAFGAATGVPRVVISAQIPGSDAWQHTESQWLKPALAQLRAGVISRLILSAGDRSFCVTARGSRRFWRRLKPWWESFA
jgi:hypothetical protein